MKQKIKFLLATIMMLVGVTATHAEDITSNIRIDVSTFCTDDNGTVTSYLKDEYTVKEGVVVTFRCLKSWDETVTIYLNGTAVATWPGDAGGSKYVWTAKKDAKINWKGYDQYSANIYLTETSTVDVTGITLDPATADMTVGGETLTLTPTVLPDNATDKTVTWTSSDESVATVANGVVTAVAPGTATITVTTTDGAKTATCTVTVAEPTYTVTVKEGTEDAASWTITPAEATTTGVAAGTEVKATYGGTKKVKSVKAVKKVKPAATVTTATTSDQGKVVCAAGHLHDAKTAVPTGCTAVGILGKVTETGHGLILALEDAPQQPWNTINGWTSVTTYAGTTLKQLPDDAARGSLTSYTTLGSTTVSNWCVAQKSDYEAIFTNLGSTGTSFDANVNAYITTDDVGTAMATYYWSASEASEYGDFGWRFYDSNWIPGNKSTSNSLRPVLGF